MNSATLALLVAFALAAAPARGQDAAIERSIDDLGSASADDRLRASESLRRAGLPALRALLRRIDPERGRGALDEDGTRRIEGWLADLGAEEYEKREAAEAELVGQGRRVLPFVRAALEAGGEDVEVRHRLQRILERVEAQGTDDLRRAQLLEILALVGLLGPEDREASEVLLGVLDGDPGIASAVAHLALRGLHPAGPSLSQAWDSLRAVEPKAVARMWREHLAAPHPGATDGAAGTTTLAALVVPAGRRAGVRTEILNVYGRERELPASREGRLPDGLLGLETSTFTEEDRGGTPRVVRRTYLEQEVGNRAAEAERMRIVPGTSASPLAGRSLDFTFGESLLVEASDDRGPLGPGDKYLISLGAILGATLPPGEYAPGHPVEMPPASALAFVPFIEDSVAFAARATAGRTVWLGRSESGRDTFSSWWHFDVDPAPAGAAESRYRVWLAGRFEVDPEARVVTRYEVEGLLLTFPGGSSIDDHEPIAFFRTDYALRE